jgi:hypothetical protein
MELHRPIGVLRAPALAGHNYKGRTAMSINTNIRTVAALAAVAGLSLTGIASAATAQPPGGPIAKPPVAGTIKAPEYAFPTGLNGGGTKKNCAYWNEVLGEDHAAVGVAIGNNDLAAYTEAKDSLDRHTNNALDAGCAVIDE